MQPQTRHWPRWRAVSAAPQCVPARLPPTLGSLMQLRLSPLTLRLRYIFSSGESGEINGVEGIGASGRGLRRASAAWIGHSSWQEPEFRQTTRRKRRAVRPQSSCGCCKAALHGVKGHSLRWERSGTHVLRPFLSFSRPRPRNRPRLTVPADRLQHRSAAVPEESRVSLIHTVQ